MRNFFMSALILLAPTVGFSQSWEEITGNFVPQYIQRSVGSSVVQPTMTFKSRCLSKLPGGGCLLVEKTKARGTLKISGLNANTGKIFQQYITDPITMETGRNFASNLYFDFSYEGQTEAELWKADNFTGYAWGTLHPEGRILVTLTANQDSSYKLVYEFRADPNAGDDPNTFMASVVAPQLKPILADHVRKILGLPNLIIQ